MALGFEMVTFLFTVITGASINISFLSFFYKTKAYISLHLAFATLTMLALNSQRAVFFSSNCWFNILWIFISWNELNCMALRLNKVNLNIKNCEDNTRRFDFYSQSLKYNF